MVNATPRPLYTPVKNPGTHWIGGWVGPQRLDGFGEEEIPEPFLDSNLRPVHHLASRRTAWATPLEMDKKITECSFALIM